MKQVVQDLRGGAVTVAEVPPPAAAPGRVLVRVAASLVSAGTERAASDFAAKGILGKARARPDLVRQVLRKARRDGVLEALRAASDRFSRPAPLGYSCAGVVIETGEGVTDVRPGDRVACAGAGYAVHAEVVSVPRALVVPLPGAVDFDHGAFVALGAIALHGLRLSEAALGETVAVIGLGLVGNLAAQLARAAGCRVLGMDPGPDRCRLAQTLGFETAATDDAFAALVERATNGLGADRILIAAAAKSDGPIALAARVARDRAAVVAIGDVGLDMPRRVAYEKELSIRVSRSCGPGRYDAAYEEAGLDYPIGYVRWTEGRNMEAFLQLLAGRRIDAERLITHRFPVDRAPDAYALISGERREPCLGVLITYPSGAHAVSFPPPAGTSLHHHSPATGEGRERVMPRPSRAAVLLAGEKAARSDLRIGLLGAGAFATGVLIPAIRRTHGIELASVCAASGLSARHAAKAGFRTCTTDERQLLTDPSLDAIVIATRHHLHAPQAVAALDAGKHVFCEKPLAIDEDGLAAVVEAQRRAPGRVVMVGFNRRFSPFAVRLRDFFADAGEPLAMTYRVNAGPLPLTHWAHDPAQGGGRIAGELCHFADLLQFLAGAAPVRVAARALPNGGRYRDDNLLVTLDFPNGSLGQIACVASGDPAFPKERIEVLGGGRAAVLDGFRRLECWRDGRRSIARSWWAQRKGFTEEWRAFAHAVASGAPSPVPFEDAVAATLATFGIQQALRTGAPVAVDTRSFLARYATARLKAA